MTTKTGTRIGKEYLWEIRGRRILRSNGSSCAPRKRFTDVLIASLSGSFVLGM